MNESVDQVEEAQMTVNHEDDWIAPASMTYVVLAAEVLRERRRHDLATDGGGGGEVRLARLAPGRRNVCEK